MEYNMGIPQKIKRRITIWSNNSTSGYFPKELKVGTWTDMYTPKFTATLFTTAKRWKQPECLSKDGWIKKNVVFTYNGILFSLKKEENAATCYNMDEPWRHAKWNKPVTKRQILYQCTYMRYLWYEWTLFKFLETESWMMFARCLRERGMEG